MRWLGLALLAGLSFGCARQAGARLASAPGVVNVDDTDSVESPEYEDLDPVLRDDPALAPALEEAASRRVQVLVALPTVDATGAPGLRRLSFRADAEYFYPASAVKLCAAVAALEKLDELRRERADLGLTTPLRVTSDDDDDRPSSLDTTLGDELRKALVVSDNDAFNRLFDFVGRDELAQRMTRLGLRSARIFHRLGAGAEGAAAGFELLGEGRPLLVAQRVGFELPAGAVAGQLVGSSHVDENGRLVDAPFDFGDKNRISLRDLQDLLVSIARPELAEGARPEMAPADRQSLLTILGTLPSELGPHVPRSLDEMHKPFLAATQAALPGHRIRVYGKGGRAYGFSVENAYVVDETSGRSAFIAVAIYANDNDRINDDRYDYASVSEPFVARVGQRIARAFLAPPRSPSEPSR